ncbi:MAG: caspase family protein [Thalassovita sp.]
MLKPIAILGAALTLTWATPLRAETHALVIGVSDYLHLDADLRGPANDVGLVTQMLVDRGVKTANIHLLASPGSRHAEGVQIADTPTHDAILDALDHLVTVAAADDTVFFYFSGHGSQAPDQNGDEGGGYDEILLPADASGWRGAIGAVDNAIVDDELALRFQTILDTGAKMVAVLDACHSATGFRALGGQASAARYVDPVSLGIPTGTTPEATGAAMPPLTGDYVFLYSSQSNQRSFEYPVGEAANPGNWYGDFTRALTQVLSRESTLSWEQALQATTDSMSRNGPAAQSPDGEGSLMTSGVFGTATASEMFETKGDRLLAGLLSGLTEGAHVAIHASLTSEAVIATATVERLDAHSARLRGDAALPATGYAKVIQPGAPAMVHMAAPLRADPADGHDYAALSGLMDTFAQADALEGVRLNATSFDLQPYLVDGALALTGRDGVLDPHGPGSSPRLELNGTDYPDVVLADFLERAARTHRMRSALAMAESGSTGGFSLFSTAVGQSVALASAQADGEGCADPLMEPQKQSAKTLPVTHCDQIWLTISNADLKAQDVTVLYVDRDFTVTAIWPEPGYSNRVPFGERQEIGLLIQNPNGAAGIEEIIVISSPARDGAPRTDLSALADPAQTRDMAQGGGALQGYFSRALSPEDTSRTLPLGGDQGLPKLDVTRYTVHLQAEE